MRLKGICPAVLLCIISVMEVKLATLTGTATGVQLRARWPGCWTG